MSATGFFMIVSFWGLGILFASAGVSFSLLILVIMGAFLFGVGLFLLGVEANEAGWLS